jgi:hypothetical protein
MSSGCHGRPIIANERRITSIDQCDTFSCFLVTRSFCRVFPGSYKPTDSIHRNSKHRRSKGIRSAKVTPATSAPAPRLRPGASARRSQAIRTVNHHPACSEIVEGQGRCPWWVSRPAASSAALRPAVTPTTPVRSLLGSSVELPSAMVELSLRRRAQTSCTLLQGPS